MAEPSPDAGRGRAPWRPARPRRGEQAAEGGHTRVAHELVDLGRQDELLVAAQAIEQFRYEGLEPLRADVPGGLPQDLDRLRHGQAIDAWPPCARARRRSTRRSPQQADRCLAVQARYGNDLVQERALLCSRGGQVPPTLHRRVLPQTRSCHGLLPRLGVGNRDFRCTTSPSVTEILR